MAVFFVENQVFKCGLILISVYNSLNLSKLILIGILFNIKY